jgi:hypothetical protein
VRLKTALDHAFNYVLKFRFRRTCCHIDDHEKTPKHLANSNWQLAKPRAISNQQLALGPWLLAFGFKSKSFLAGEGACAPQSKKQLAIGN